LWLTGGATPAQGGVRLESGFAATHVRENGRESSFLFAFSDFFREKGHVSDREPGGWMLWSLRRIISMPH
jgi:hypothetical protein